MSSLLPIWQGSARASATAPRAIVSACVVWSLAGPGLLNAQPASQPPLPPLLPASQSASPHPAPTDAVAPAPIQLQLNEVFERAWARHPAQRALAQRRAASQSALKAAQSWSTQPASLDIRTQTDRPGTDQGAREVELGVSVPLWWPGQRTRAQQWAQAQGLALDARVDEARLSLAGTLRDAWWAWLRAEVEVQLAAERAHNAATLLADVKRRVVAGDLAQADQHQAAGALALAEGAHLQALAQRSWAAQALAACGGWHEGTAPRLSDRPEDSAEALTTLDAQQHPAVRSARQQAMAAREAAALAGSQVRANPEVTLGTVHSRGPRGEATQRALVLGLRVPLGSSPAQTTHAIQSGAEATELEAQADMVRAEVEAAFAGARQRLTWAQAQRDAAAKRARLAQETQAFFDKSFKWGETDLPTRLRIAQEAQEAARQAALAQIDVAAAVSALRQAAGLLPD